MKKLILVILIVALFAPAVLAAETSNLEERRLEFEEQRLEYEKRVTEYDDVKKNTLLAPVISSVIPTGGHYYAGNWGRGANFLLAQLGGLALAQKGFEEGEDTLGQMGIALTVISRLIEPIDAYNTAINYNEELKRRLEIKPGLENGIGANVEYSF